MKYYLEVEETVTRTITYVINVKNEEEGEDIADNVESEFISINHSDDVAYAISQYSKVLDVEEGAEDCEYELTDSGVKED